MEQALYAPMNGCQRRFKDFSNIHDRIKILEFGNISVWEKKNRHLCCGTKGAPPIILTKVTALEIKLAGGFKSKHRDVECIFILNLHVNMWIMWNHENHVSQCLALVHSRNSNLAVFALFHKFASKHAYDVKNDR